MGRIFALSVLVSAQIALGKRNVCLPFLVEPTHTSCEQHKKVSLKEDCILYILEFVQRLLFGAKMLNAKLQVAVTIGPIELISSDARVFSRACVWLLNHAGIKAHWTRNLH